MSEGVVLGFSGGVDSACAAEMLRRRAEERRIDEGLVVVMALTTYARERRLAV